MFTLISGSKIVGEAATFKEACDLAKNLSKVPSNLTRTIAGIQYTGQIVSVWSGPIVKGRGVVAHASYACGFSW